jgi:AAA family ATP:ADP antiporter
LLLRIRRLVGRTAGVGEDELGPALLSAVLFFCLLCSYYILRPVREDMGIAGGVENLPYLYLVTLAAMLLVAPLFGALVRHFRREVFVPAVLHVVAVNLLLFFILLRMVPPAGQVNLGRVFYVWLSVVNLFMLSIFWSFLADGLGLERSKRLFGFIAVGGTAGAWLGASITGGLVGIVGRAPLLLISAGFVEIAVLLVAFLTRRFPQADGGPELAAAQVPSPREAWEGRAPEPGGSILGGIALTVRSPYLLAVAGYLCLYSVTSTFAYFEQASIVDAAAHERAVRIGIFASIDFWVNLVTLVTQLFLTGRVIRRLGTGWTLAALPVATAVGFVALGVAPTLTVLVVFQVVRKTSNYALAKPARETLFAILDRNGKYKAKNFLDTFVRRGGDVLGAGLFDVLARAGLGLAGAAFVAVPIAVLWGGLSLFLGREQNRKAAASRSRTEVAPASTS